MILVAKIPVDIPLENVHEAIDRAHRTARSLQGKKNYDGETDNGEHRYGVGYVGEYCFSTWCKSCGILYFHRKSDQGVSLRSEFEIGRYTIECKGASRPDSDRMIIGKNRDLTASIFVHSRSRVPDWKAGLWELCAWWPRREVEPYPAIHMHKGSPCREIPHASATREFSVLEGRLWCESHPEGLHLVAPAPPAPISPDLSPEQRDWVREYNEYERAHGA